LGRAPADASALVSADAIAARYADVMAAIDRLRGEIEAARLDALIVIGDDQSELFSTRLMPAFAVYYGAEIRNDARRPVHDDLWYARAQMARLEEGAPRSYPCHQPLALHLINSLIAGAFDVTAMEGLEDDQFEGHAFSFVHRFYLAEHALPIVPVFLNTFYPPNQPTPGRCIALGQSIRRAIDEFPGDLRVGLLASGGLSHFQVEEDLDRGVIQMLQEGDAPGLAALDPKRLQSGSSEIRNWLVLAGAVRNLTMDWVSYTPAYRTPALTGTGLCFASWKPK
jgi:3-O-methylgallate 3,4-dioxygenase